MIFLYATLPPVFFSCLFCSFSQSLGKCADSSWPSAELSNRPKRHSSLPLIKWKTVNFVFDKDVLSTEVFFLLPFLFCLLFISHFMTMRIHGPLTDNFSFYFLFCHAKSVLPLVIPVVRPSHLLCTSERQTFFF